VLLARAFNSIYDLKLTVYGEMNVAHSGEQVVRRQCQRTDYVGSFESGVVDMKFESSPLDIEAEEVDYPCVFHLVVAQLGNGGGGGDGRRRGGGGNDVGSSSSSSSSSDGVAAEIYSALGACYPVARDAASERVHELLGSYNQTIISEAVRVLKLENPDGSDAVDANGKKKKKKDTGGIKGTGKGARQAAALEMKRRRADERQRTVEAPAKLGALMSSSQAIFDKCGAPVIDAATNKKKNNNNNNNKTVTTIQHLLESDKLHGLLHGGKSLHPCDGTRCVFACVSRRAQDQVVDVLSHEYGVVSHAVDVGPPEEQQ
jgi:hypothetical protein